MMEGYLSGTAVMDSPQQGRGIPEVLQQGHPGEPSLLGDSCQTDNALQSEDTLRGCGHG